MKSIVLKSAFNISSLLVVVLFLFSSCDEKIPNDIVVAGPLQLKVSDTELILSQKNSLTTNAISLEWTTGSNNGTGSSISYELQMDVKGQNFSNPMRLNMGKGVYAKSFVVETINDSLLNRLNCVAGIANEIEVRVIATIYSNPNTTEISPVITVKVTPFQPVSKTLFLYGSASPKATDLTSPVKLTPQTNDPTIFVYQGILNAGNLKFLTVINQLLPSYNMGSDTTKIVKRVNDTDPDQLFTIYTSGVYRVEVNLLDLSVLINKINYPAYGEVYLAGTASPFGNDLTKATKLTQSATDPFVFTYQGVLKAGDFKFPVNRNADGMQDMFMRIDDTKFYVHQGGTAGDDKWNIAKKGYYTLTLNQRDNTLTIYREKLYMVGSATPAGWTIANAIQMTEDVTDGCIFTWSGNMSSGEFKLPVNRNTDWGQDMYMKVDDTKMYRHTGGQPDDVKWSIGSSGTYIVTANIETLSISIVKQ